MRRALALVAVVAAGVVALVIVQVSQSSTLAFTLGAAPQAPLAKVDSRQTVCQNTINVPPSSAFDRVALQVGTNGRPGSRLDVTILRRRVPIAAGTLRAGYPDVPPGGGFRTIPVGHVAGGQQIEVCVTNQGQHAVSLYGSGELANRVSNATLNGNPTNYDLALLFERPSRSRASLIGDVFQRASLFRPGFVGAWTYWVLAALMVLAVPALLWRALGGVEDAPTDAEPGPRADRV
jgi:hypothetical protein